MTTRNNVITLADVRAKRDAILRAAESLGATNVRVFGSVARHEADEKSDVDLLVDIVVDISGFRYFGLLEDLRRAFEAILGHDVHVTDGESPARIGDSVRRDCISL